MNKFNIDVTIINTRTYEIHKLYLVAEFVRSSSNYGNGIYLSILGRGKTKFEQMLDLRYEPISTSNLETVALDWVYRFWSGQNGAWDVMKVTIENVELEQLARGKMKADVELT